MNALSPYPLTISPIFQPPSDMAAKPTAPKERVVIHACRIDDLPAQLRAANIPVPGRAHGRTSEHAELYGAIRLLASQRYGLGDFPLTLKKRERPDFVLTLDDVVIGIEHTEAISQNDAKAAALRDAGIGPEVYYSKPTSLSELPKTSKQLEEDIQADEMGDGWCGDSVERDWADAMTHFVEKKVASTQREGYTRHPRLWLLIYDNWPSPGLNLHNALPRLREQLTARSVWSTFERIFILDENLIVEIDASQEHLHCVNHCE